VREELLLKRSDLCVDAMPGDADLMEPPAVFIDSALEDHGGAEAVDRLGVHLRNRFIGNAAAKSRMWDDLCGSMFRGIIQNNKLDH
jgi:hypothetical protein